MLSYSPPDCLPEADISKISDPLLLDYQSLPLPRAGCLPLPLQRQRQRRLDA